MTIHNNVQSLLNRCYAVDYEIGYLVFEDLSETNYYMVDRSNGLDTEHLRSILDKLAKWHATTAVILDKVN